MCQSINKAGSYKSTGKSQSWGGWPRPAWQPVLQAFAAIVYREKNQHGSWRVLGDRRLAGGGSSILLSSGGESPVLFSTGGHPARAHPRGKGTAPRRQRQPARLQMVPAAALLPAGPVLLLVLRVCRELAGPQGRAKGQPRRRLALSGKPRTEPLLQRACRPAELPAPPHQQAADPHRNLPRPLVLPLRAAGRQLPQTQPRVPGAAEHVEKPVATRPAAAPPGRLAPQSRQLPARRAAVHSGVQEQLLPPGPLLRTWRRRPTLQATGGGCGKSCVRCGTMAEDRDQDHTKPPPTPPPQTEEQSSDSRINHPVRTWVQRVRQGVHHFKVRLGPGGHRQAHIVVGAELLWAGKGGGCDAAGVSASANALLLSLTARWCAQWQPQASLHTARGACSHMCRAPAAAQLADPPAQSAAGRARGMASAPAARSAS